MRKLPIKLLLSLSVCLSAHAQTAHFKSFDYQGNDTRFSQPINPTKQYYNPILAGFYPDPSICRAGDTYYLVNSSFSFYPGVPLHKSKDLVHWQLVGHVLDRPSQLPLEHQRVSGGIFAPAIPYNENNKTFYMITTNVGRGNFFVKSKNPEKGWSDPIYLPKINGIDPSFFFDKNGQGYIVHNGPVDGTTEYNGQRAIRIFKFDVKGDSIVGHHKEIVRGGTHVEPHPIWIEGPHLYRIGKYYYLMCAEGGTGGWHSEVILRAPTPMGPWEENPHNPILTQRTGLSPQRPNVVTSAGHADMVQSKTGDWWAVFLACRPYEDDFYNTGRDTYLLPVTWKDGWPEILEKGKAISPIGEKANLCPNGEQPMSGNFCYHDSFDGQQLNSRWMFLRNPSAFWSVAHHQLHITPLPVNIYQLESPSAVWTRQQHENFCAETVVDFSPRTEQELAGMALLQNEDYNFVFGKTLLNGRPTLTLVRAEKQHTIIASTPIPDGDLHLKIEGRGRYYNFLYAVANEPWQVLCKGVDAINLSTGRSGGFIGACIGLYATTQKDDVKR